MNEMNLLSLTMILKASCRLRPDGPDVLNETVYEFYGCKFHGCHKCYNQGQHLYNTTMERENTLKAAGSKLISIWECECYGMKTHMSSTKNQKLQRQADNEHRTIRDNLFGSRTEAF